MASAIVPAISASGTIRSLSAILLADASKDDDSWPTGFWSGAERDSSSRMAASLSPRSIRIVAARHFSSRRIPSNTCSVPMCRCCSRSASSAAFFRILLHSSVNGRSMDVDTFSRIVVRPSIWLRMLSIDEELRRKRWVRFLSSRIRPSRKCSDSIVVLPCCAASYLAKKITRLARSVYRSNIGHTKLGEVMLQVSDVVFRDETQCDRIAIADAADGIELVLRNIPHGVRDM